VYRTLTGNTGDHYPFFSGLLEHIYPSSVNTNILDRVTDNPYPLAQVSFRIDNSTFGKVQDVINTSAGIWQKAFWLVIEVLKNSSYALGLAASNLLGRLQI
jgi:hypothetical protein